MFGEDSSESPRMPSPWLALSPSLSHSPSPRAHPLSHTSSASRTPSPQIEPLDLNTALGAFSEKLSQSLSSSFSSLSISPAMGEWEGDDLVEGVGRAGISRRRSSGVMPGTEGVVMPRLVPEVEEGNIEYKLKLIAPTPDRFARLVTQLKWRLLEGGGQAIYEIGVADSGQLVGLTQVELEESLETLERMADELGGTVLVTRAIEVPVLRGRIEGAGRVRGVGSAPSSTSASSEALMGMGDSAAAKVVHVKRHGKYNHPVGREWEATSTSTGAMPLTTVSGSSRRDKKLAVKLKKRETLAGSNPLHHGGARRASSGAVPARKSPLSEDMALPLEEDDSSDGSDTASTASTASASVAAPFPIISALASTSAASPPPGSDPLPPLTGRKPRQISQSHGDPLLKAMAKRMKRDQARERGKGLLAPPVLTQNDSGMMEYRTTKETGTEGLVQTGLAVPGVVPTQMSAAPHRKPDVVEDVVEDSAVYDLDANVNAVDLDEEDVALEQTRWIVEVQVLRKMDADAGEGFLDFEGFGLE